MRAVPLISGFRDHPRPCGEKRISRLITMGQAGSPPPMRGKERKQVFFAAVAGITPAHAGKSCIKLDKGNKFKDHPRPCGEKALDLAGG